MEFLLQFYETFEAHIWVSSASIINFSAIINIYLEYYNILALIL